MVVVGTYNMSFAGDANPDGDIPGFASEYKFHLRDTERPRTFWNNAKEHLKHFIDNKKPLAVGLQEMNLKTDGETGGVEAIKQMLDTDTYEMVSKAVETNKAGISIIFDKTIAGDVIKTECVDNPNQSNGPGRPTGGRPLLMVLTKNNYLFVSMHGAQNGQIGNFEDDFNTYMINNNKNFLQAEVTTFLGDTVPDHIYIMGDFNDRYDAITEFEIKGEAVLYKDGSPAACCHNWDSMGKETERVKIQKKQLEGPTLEAAAAANDSEKVQGKTSITINGEEKKGNIQIPTEHGFAIADYINKGDKVFTKIDVAGKLAIYTSEHNIAEDGGSKASDHELVYMETTGAAPAAGGKRKSRKGRKSKKNKKSNRKTKKMARKSKKRGKK